MKTTFLFFISAVLFTQMAYISPALAQGLPPTAGNAQSVPTAGNAQNPGPSGQSLPKLKNPIYADSVEKLLFTIVDLAIFIGVIVAVFMFIFIGFKLVMAQGDKAALLEAKNWFIAATIGTAILIGSKVIVEVIKNTLTSAGVVKEELFKKP